MAMTAGIIAAIAYEFSSDDLLSMAVDRWRGKHPIWIRFWVLALAGHWGGLIPPAFDIFNAKNLLHRGVFHLIAARARATHAVPFCP